MIIFSGNRLSAMKKTLSGVIIPTISKKCPGRGTDFKSESATAPGSEIISVTVDCFAMRNLFFMSLWGNPP